jgi:hypothetical protein
MTKVTCARRACSEPATVATRTAGGAVDEHLCESHAWETVQAKVATLSRFTYMGTKRPFVAVSVQKADAA